MSYALMSSGGKDSTLALDRAHRSSMDVRWLVNIYDGVTSRVAFHGVRRELIAAQAESCGLEYVAHTTGPTAAYEQVFEAAMRDLTVRGASGVVFGNIHLADVRAWYEERVRAAGLDHIEPLWGDPPEQLVAEVVARGFRCIVVSVDLNQGAEALFGREIDATFLKDLRSHPVIDPCGERGEFHSYVYDGPSFSRPIPIAKREIREEKNHRLLDLVLDLPE